VRDGLIELFMICANTGFRPLRVSRKDREAPA